MLTYLTLLSRFPSTKGWNFVAQFAQSRINLFAILLSLLAKQDTPNTLTLVGETSKQVYMILPLKLTNEGSYTMVL